MRVVDTSAWLEWLSDSALGRRVGVELPAREFWIVPTVVQYELARLLVREASEDAADDTIAFSTKCLVTPLDTQLAVRAAEIAANNALSMADAVVYATAVASGADVLTCDAHFAKLPHVVYLAKGSR
jgi:predicted nucleic acid-binding protein